MAHIIKKIWHLSLHAALSALAFLMVLLALLQIVLMAGFSLLNTGTGRDLVQKEINTLTQDTPYRITLGSLFYDPVRGLTLYDLSIADETGPVLDLDRVSAAIAFERLLARHLDIMVKAGTLTLHRMPGAQDTPPDGHTEPSGTPSALPDLYFTRASTMVQFGKIIIGPDIAGDEIILSPKISATVQLDNSVKAYLTIEPRTQKNDLPVPLPDTMTFTGLYDPAKQQAAIELLEILSGAYSLRIKGNSDLSDKGAQDYTLDAAYGDLTSLTGGQFRSATLNARLSGTTGNPVIEAAGQLSPGTLSAQGLADIDFTITPDFSGDVAKALVKLESEYRDAPVLLTAHVSYAAPKLTIESLNAQAPYLLASGYSTLDTDTMLADGSIEIEAKDLSHYKDLVGMALSGTIKANATLAPADGKQSVSADITATSFRYDTLEIERLSANAMIADISHPWPQSGKADVQSLSLPGDFSIAKLSVSITENGPETYRLALNGKGRMHRPFTIKAAANVSDLTNSLPSIRDIDASLSIRESLVRISGLVTAEMVDLSAATKEFRVRDLPVDVPRNATAASITGKLSVTGSPVKPAAQADLILDGLDTGEYKGFNIVAGAVYKNDLVTVDVNGKGTGIRTLSANAMVPLSFSLAPFSFTFEDTAALKGAAEADIDLAAIANILMPPTHTLTGALDAQAVIGGTIAAPAINGTARLSNGLYKGIDTGIDIHDIAASANFDRQSVTLDSLTATDGEQGTLKGSGRIGFGAAQSTLSLSVRRFHIPKEGMAEGYVSADLGLDDRKEGYALTGDIILDEMNINIPERFSASIPELNIVRRRDREQRDTAKTILLDMTLKAENQVFVRGWGLDAEFGGEVAVTGTIGDPQLNGNFTARRGRYEEFGKRFELETADLRFQGSVPPSPYLDIKATTDAEDVKASVILSGPAQKPTIGFSSVPALPEDEVLARILFGKSTVKISPFQAIQLTQTLQRFSGNGGGGLDPLGTLRSLTGFDDISVETNDAGETNVGVGKYLTDKVYLEFERGKAENSGAASLQVEVTPSINLETEVGQDARAGGGVFWSHDY